MKRPHEGVPMTKVPLALIAFGDLLGRYGRALRLAWKARAELAPPRRLPHELQFLPAAQSLQETPLSPAPHVAIGLLLGFAALALLWAVFGRLDIVAVAPGRVVPAEGSKTVQPLEAGTVRAIRVAEGQMVRAGDVLIELDPTVTQADLQRSEGELAAARLQIARGQALLDAVAGEHDAPLRRPASVSDGDFDEARRMLAGQVGEHLARLARLDAERGQREASRQSTLEAVRKLEQTVPLARQRAADLKDLADRNFVSRHGYLEREQARIEQEADLATMRSRLNEMDAGLLQSRRQRDQLVAEARRAALDGITAAQQRVAALEQEQRKAAARRDAQRLLAPVDGTVQQLAVHTVGGVVTAAQPLMMVVPSDTPLEIEALVENRDVGFVMPGQPAEVKVETFPYTRYGVLHGRVASVSSDAINDDKRGLVYSTRVRLDRKTIEIDGRTVPLSAGMSVSAEVKIGTRRVIDFVLAPLISHATEGLRER
jgi:hemolysin D